MKPQSLLLAYIARGISPLSAEFAPALRKFLKRGFSFYIKCVAEVFSHNNFIPIAFFEKLILVPLSFRGFTHSYRDLDLAGYRKIFVLNAIFSASKPKKAAYLANKFLQTETPVSNAIHEVLASTKNYTASNKIGKLKTRMVHNIKKNKLCPTYFLECEKSPSVHEGVFASWGINHFYQNKVKYGPTPKKLSGSQLSNEEVTILAVYTAAISFYSATALILKEMGYAVTLLIHPRATGDGSVPDPVNQILIENESEKLVTTLGKFGLKVVLLNRYEEAVDLDGKLMECIDRQSSADVQTASMNPVLNLECKEIADQLKFRKRENISFAKRFVSYVRASECSHYIIDSGSWAEYGAAFSILRGADKQITCMAFRNQRGYVVVSKNSPFTELDVEDEWRQMEKKELIEGERHQARRSSNELSERSFYEREAYFSFQTEDKLSVAEVRSRYFINSDKFTVLILPNVAWDTTMLIDRPNIIFDHHADWFVNTVEYFKSRNDLNVIIRPHPAERVFKCEHNTQTLFLANSGNQFNHLKMIDTSSTVNTYGLVDAADLIVFYTSDIGWEAVVREKTAMAGGRGPSWGKGITHDSKTREEYFLTLERLIGGEVSQPELLQRKERAERFMFLYLHKIPLAYPFPNGSFWSEECEVLLNEILNGRETKFDETFRLLVDKRPNSSGFIIS